MHVYEKRILFMLVFVLFEISTWAFLFAWRLESVILDQATDNHSTALYQVIDPSLAIIPRIYILILVLKSFTTPSDPLSPSKFTLYNYHFLLFFSMAIISSFLRCFSYFVITHGDHWVTSWTIETSFAVTNLVINLILWATSATAPSELDQGELLDFDDTDDGVMVLLDGRVVRNGRILSLEANASVLSCITFRWMNSLLHDKTNKQPLTSDQLWSLPLRLRSQENDKHFRAVSNSILLSSMTTTTTTTTGTLSSSSSSSLLSSSTSPSWSLAYQIYRSNQQAVMLQFVTAITAVLFHYANPYFLRRLLQYIQDPQDQPYYTGYLYCFAIFGSSILSTLVASQTLLWGRRWHVSLTNMLDSSIYAHTLKMPHYGKQGIDGTTLESDRHDTNVRLQHDAKLMNTDVERLAELASHLHIFYTCPLEISAGIIFLYHILGNSFFVGLVVMTVTLPVTHFISRKLARIQKRLAEAKSWRIQLLRGFCEGIRTTKFLAWERKWEQMIMTARGEELVQLIKLYSQNAILGLIWFATPIFVTTISFAWYTLVQGNKLDARSSLDRIYSFLNFTEHWNQNNNSNNNTNSNNNDNNNNNNSMTSIQHRSYEEQVKVGFIGGIIKSGPDPRQFHHRHHHHHILDIVTTATTRTSNNNNDASTPATMVVPTFDFPPGELSVITGSASSGKTRLIYSLLGEDETSFDGQAILPSRFLATPRAHLIQDPHYPGLALLKVAYVSQIPWLETGTIRTNILFMEPWDDARYRSVLYQCDLIKDLSQLENGDLTTVGENGTTLSDVLKGKISLARAMFSKAKTVIIDDIFSNLDMSMSNLLLERCTLHDGGSANLMKGRTLIIATRCDLGLWAQPAKLVISMSTSAAAVKIRIVDQEQYIKAMMIKQDNNKELDNLQKKELKQHFMDDGDRRGTDTLLEGTSSSSSSRMVMDEDYFDEGSVMRDSILETDDESQQHGTRSRDLAYATYFTACGGWFFWLSAVSLTVLTRLSSLGESYWLKEGNTCQTFKN
ncbi:uncharacterized protein BX664DRAFT_365696 [Halteromyces radiatus]|uniref:uncharacterized protein n=1 Tax=Halteromyces radiatus TaxID=101107 RepID=UPI00221E54B2|nr:uncharacterized protein BX664DRAFT_365696 [Halteromyces radiatus]KAI8089911.1 hypothetical protein BX664DRAFT_365696 [Halteromyces radiatus]